MLLAGEVRFAGSASGVTLATFQTAAMGALLHLDAEFDTDHAARFVTADGFRHQWIDGPPHKEHHDSPDISPASDGPFSSDG